MVRLDFVALNNRTICYLIKQFFSGLVVESFCLIPEWENNSSGLYNIILRKEQKSDYYFYETG